jgi:hypothetical protein
MFSEFRDTLLDFRRIVLQLFKIECQHCEALVDIVVKLSCDSGALLLLSFQLSTHVVLNDGEKKPHTNRTQKLSFLSFVSFLSIMASASC